MAKEIKISTIGMNCPKPLIETRKALRKMTKGQILIVDGDHPMSFQEIPQAVKDTGDKVLSTEQTESSWEIKIRKGA